MLEVVISICTLAIVAELFAIASKLGDITTALRKIASARETEIGITVPGNKTVTLNLPDGGKIYRPMHREDDDE